jgi:hypothetical protein
MGDTYDAQYLDWDEYQERKSKMTKRFCKECGQGLQHLREIIGYNEYTGEPIVHVFPSPKCSNTKCIDAPLGLKLTPERYTWIPLEEEKA